MYRIGNHHIEHDNTIGVAIKRGTTVFVYGTKGNILCTKTGDEVMGYTCKTFAIRQGKTIYVHDSTGKLMYAKPSS